MIDREQIADIVEEVTGDDRLRYAKPRTVALRIADRILRERQPVAPGGNPPSERRLREIERRVALVREDNCWVHDVHAIKHQLALKDVPRLVAAVRRLRATPPKQEQYP